MLPTQHSLQYPCTAPTAKIFAGVSPSNKFQQVHKFIHGKRKLLNTTVASFCRHTAHKNRNTAKFGTRQFTVRGHSTQHTTLDSQKLVPNNMSSSHTVTNFDKLAYETTRASFPDHLGKCKKPPLAQCATKNYLGRAFPAHAQQGTGTIK